MSFPPAQLIAQSSLQPAHATIIVHLTRRHITVLIKQRSHVVQAGTGRASAFDNLIAAIGAALEADRTLGGLCDWIDPEAPASVDLPIEGAAALKAAEITVVLHYTTTGPLA